MGYFDKKIKKAKENEFKLNNKMHTKLIEKANCRYVNPPIHSYVKLVRDLDNPEEVNLFIVPVNKYGYPEIIKLSREIKWEYKNVDEMYENGETDLLKTLDDIYETNYFYKSRVGGKKGNVIKEFNLKEKHINTNEREKPKNLDMKKVVQLSKII